VKLLNNYFQTCILVADIKPEILCYLRPPTDVIFRYLTETHSEAISAEFSLYDLLRKHTSQSQTLSRTVETARTARQNKLKRDAVEIGKREVTLKHAEGEKDEDVVPWKALLINN